MKTYSVACYSHYNAMSVPTIQFTGSLTACREFIGFIAKKRGVLKSDNEAFVDGQFTYRISTKTGPTGLRVGFGDHWL